MCFLGRTASLVGRNWNWNQGKHAVLWIKCSLVFIASLGKIPHLFWCFAQSSTRQWMDKLFMSNGFLVDMISYEDVAMNLGKQLAAGRYKNILFAAEQLRFSDDQVRRLVFTTIQWFMVCCRVTVVFWWSDKEKQSNFSSLSICEMPCYV